MPVDPQYKLIYFDLEGRAEIARLMFAQADCKYEDIRIPFEKWPDMKPRLYGEGEWEHAKIDEIGLKIAEDIGKIAPTFHESDPAKKAEMYRPQLETIVKPLFEILEKKLTESKSGWLIGKQISLADITAFHTANVFSDNPRLPPNDFDLKKFPHVADLYHRVAEEPNIKRYLEAKKQRLQKVAQ